MGWHECTYPHDKQSIFCHQSSGDVTLRFANGRAWVMPDMILHYVADHKWLPPTAFVDDVMTVDCTGGERRQTRGGPMVQPVSVGYLSGSFQTGQVSDGFLERLEALMLKYDTSGNVATLRNSNFRHDVTR